MTQRYFVESPISGPEAVLADAEAHHLAHVMRLKAGAEVVLFDGGGAEFLARVENVGKRETRLEVLERREISRELPRRITVCTALPRGDRQKWLIEKAVEIGVGRLVPLHTERAVVVPDGDTCVKLRRAVIEASKQCGRNVLLEIAEPAPLRDAVQRGAGGPLSFLAQPGSELSLAAAAREAATMPNEPAEFFIGPEGGFSPAEEGLILESGRRGINLGNRILRIETAVVLCGAWGALAE
ncbi:MAG: 16S rRNA (uracil(1498)-N(3))-methyltransferase [Planctomycetales bacterium]|nr:16S rRNA (uracil(1498)-N(3))-methyltransferase [Planctomycetales bacterium]MBN8624572.1 16S rRNA (uracil(1498)-N(3))-methyltransferase [Planctomycetota bacterium]